MTKAQLPTGTVTFLYTDIQDSTPLWQDLPQAMAASHERHNTILQAAIRLHNGYVFRGVADSFSVAFHNASDGLNAALAAQRGLNSEPWGETGPIQVRMGLHTGKAEIAEDGEYDGYVTLTSVQRTMAAAHGGQVLITQTTRDLLENDMPADVALRDLGEHRLKGLREPLRIYQLLAAGLQLEFPAIRSLNVFPNNLPGQLTSFIGREKERTEILELIGKARLVTLTGSGGTGKTRLSIEIGGELLPAFQNGVWFVELAPLTDASQILPALGQVLGLQEIPMVPLAVLVVNYLREKIILLILDNCEHLVEACARLAADLLRQCAGLKILASSREALGVAGEITFPIPSLAETESTLLYLERAKAVNPRFELTESNRAAVAQICHRLDGIPLAIELAAARARLLSTEQIADRLDDLFRLLVGGSRTALPRQQTLRAAIDWSYELLTEEEKRLIQVAAVFGGGWTLDAIEAVAEDPHTFVLLEQLVNKSLVAVEERRAEMRFRLFESIRQYAREKLFEEKRAANARDRHFRYFDALSDELWDILRLTYRPGLREKMDDEAENFLAALEWGLENQAEDAVHLAGHYCIMASFTNKRSEGTGLVDRAIERVKALPPAAGDLQIDRQKKIAKALFIRGLMEMAGGDMRGVKTVFEEAIAISRTTGDRLILGYSLCMLAVVSDFIPVENAIEAAEEAAAIFPAEIDDSYGLSLVYQNYARGAAARRDAVEAEKYIRKIKDLLQDIPLSYQTGVFFFGMGVGNMVLGDFDSARQLLEDALRIFTLLRHKNFQVASKSELGHIARRTGNPKQAREIYRETLPGWQDLGHLPAIAHQLECFAMLAQAEGEPLQAAVLAGAANTLREKLGLHMMEHERIEYDRFTHQLTTAITEQEFNARWAEGQSLSMNRAVQLALDSK